MGRKPLEARPFSLYMMLYLVAHTSSTYPKSPQALKHLPVYQAFKFGLYLVVPITLTLAVTMSPDFLKNVLENVRACFQSWITQIACCAHYW